MRCMVSARVSSEASAYRLVRRFPPTPTEASVVRRVVVFCVAFFFEGIRLRFHPYPTLPPSPRKSAVPDRKEVLTVANVAQTELSVGRCSARDEDALRHVLAVFCGEEELTERLHHETKVALVNILTDESGPDDST
eukprot:Sspe_Gene.85759::Locus_56505_Transcript_1_1_Confidence_1.000_Length_530::g.85759::m.85759